jgi:hypothetical protein
MNSSSFDFVELFRIKPCKVIAAEDGSSRDAKEAE